METPGYSLTGPIGERTLGLVVLKVDETVEHDFRRIFPVEDVALHVTRVASGDELTPETIDAMARELGAAASLLPPAARFDAVGYACTSGAARIGAPRVAETVSRAAATQAVTDPLTATLAACSLLGVVRVAILSPYIPQVAEPIVGAFTSAGLTVGATMSFNESAEARVARIDPASIASAARGLATRSAAEALFLSCTNLRTLDIIAPLEETLGIPVVSSNQALAWHMVRLAGITSARIPGRLGALASGQGSGTSASARGTR